jgi:endonuclease V-like protein UPF0215 family
LRRHTISIDDAPFDKKRGGDVLVIGVGMAGPALVEGVMTTSVPMDGSDVAPKLAAWVRSSRFHPSLRAVLLEGLTIAGLSVIDLPLLAAETGLPAISVDRKVPPPGRLEATLEKLGMGDRIRSVQASGPLHEAEGLHFACAGVSPEEARAILAENRGRSAVPEGLRLAHLIGQGVVLGESRGS